MREQAIILFTKSPSPRNVKTRLQPCLTGEECCKLQRAFILDIYSELLKTDADIAVCYTPDGSIQDLEALAPDAAAFFPQYGDSLGDRMHNAFSHMLGLGYRRCLLIGSDIPLVSAEDVGEMLILLGNYDIVLCPTVDGGYYLIGMNEPCERLFQLEVYGVSTVFEKTIAAAVASGKTLAIGPQAMDIDNPQDLIVLAEKLKHESAIVCKETRRVIKALGQTPFYNS